MLLPRNYISVVLRDTGERLYGGFNEAEAHKIATKFSESRTQKIYRDITPELKNAYNGRNPEDFLQFSPS